MSAANRPPIVPRLFLQQAMVALEATLQRNDQKACWLNHTAKELREKLAEEMDELAHELDQPDEDRRFTRAEALDVAAVALFIWAKAGGSNTVDRGREVAHV